MTATTLTRHPVMPLAELVRDLRPETQALAIVAIQRALNAAHHYEERMDEAQDIANQIEAAEHSHAPFESGTTRYCYRCWLEQDEQRVLGAAERSRALLEGKP